MTTEIKPLQDNSVSTKVDFGDGRYSNVMRELFKDSQRLLNLTPKQAEKAARTFGADVGRHLADCKAKGVTIGKPNKDGQITLGESVSKLKGVTLTPSMNIAKLCSLLQDAKKFGILDYDVTLADYLADWLDGE